MASARPQCRQRIPRIRPSDDVDGGVASRVSVDIAGSREARAVRASGPGTGRDRLGGVRGLRREFPYLAGGPARIWHLADSTPVGCRGFNGPVPLPLLIRALRLCADATGQTAPASTCYASPGLILPGQEESVAGDATLSRCCCGGWTSRYRRSGAAHRRRWADRRPVAGAAGSHVTTSGRGGGGHRVVPSGPGRASARPRTGRGTNRSAG